MDEIKINIPTTVLNELHVKGKAKFNHEHFYPGYVTLYNEDVDKSELTQHFDQLLTESYIILNNWSINIFNCNRYITMRNRLPILCIWGTGNT